jgi:DNA-directed RNA polymerase specialized sigma24 family protein
MTRDYSCFRANPFSVFEETSEGEYAASAGDAYNYATGLYLEGRRDDDPERPWRVRASDCPIRSCRHGFQLNRGDVVGQSTFCSQCFPVRPPHVTRDEYGNGARNGFVPVMWRTVRKRARLRCFADACDAMTEARMALMRKATKVNAANPLGADKYVESLVKNFIYDRQVVSVRKDCDVPPESAAAWQITGRAEARQLAMDCRTVAFETSATGDPNSDGDDTEFESLSRGACDLTGHYHSPDGGLRPGFWEPDYTVEEALDALSPRHQRAVDRLLYGDKLHEIATQLGCSTKTVRRLLTQVADEAAARR